MPRLRPSPDGEPARSDLTSRILALPGGPVCVRLDPALWSALEAAAVREGLELKALVAAVEAARGRRPLTSALRVLAVRYWRALAERPEAAGSALVAALAGPQGTAAD